MLAALFVTSAAGSSRKLLIASDVHFNPMADPALVPALAATDFPQWEGIFQQSKLTAFSPYGQDTNWWLLRSSLDAMQRTEPHPAVVMFTGDALAHNFSRTFLSITHDTDPEHYRAFVLKTVQFVALEFRKRYPDASILLTPGNNDDECSDYSIEANGTFLSDTAAAARDLAKANEAFLATWKRLGSYKVTVPKLPGIRILSINTVFFSNKYRAASFASKCAIVNSTAAEDLLTWLESEVAQAEQAHEKVWLMFHIPPGIDGWASTHQSASSLAAGATSSNTSCVSSIVPMWVPEWTARFDGLLERYSKTVLASFAGHTHSDDFRVITSANGSDEFVLIDPAVSPVYGQNPGFRVVEFNRDGTLADQTTYYLTNLLKASRNTRGHWKREYKFSRQWKVKRLDGASLAKIDERIINSSNTRNAWLKLYMVSSSADPIPSKDLRGLYCAIAGLDPKNYASCYCGAEVPQASMPNR